MIQLSRALLFCVATLIDTAHAAQRSFVASLAATPTCTIGAPCRGFAQAPTHTDTGGEIIVLDSAGYGTVTIDKSVSIVAPSGVYAGTSVLSGDGITFAGSGIEVVLRGLTVTGQGGHDGIFYTFGERLHVENGTGLSTEPTSSVARPPLSTVSRSRTEMVAWGYATPRRASCAILRCAIPLFAGGRSVTRLRQRRRYFFSRFAWLIFTSVFAFSDPTYAL